MTKTNAQAKTAARNAKADTKPLQNSDLITEVKPAKSGGEYTAVSTGPAAKGGLTTMVPNSKMIGAVAKAAVIGGSYKAFVAAWEKAKASSPAMPAKGVDGRSAPHASKAIADARAKANNKADAVTQKPAPKAKAEKPAKEATKSKYSGAYKWTGENKARQGTWRYAMLECAKKNTTTDAGDACLKKDREFGSQKMDWRWMANQGYIKFA